MHGPILLQGTDKCPDTRLNASSRQEQASIASDLVHAQSDGCPFQARFQQSFPRASLNL